MKRKTLADRRRRRERWRKMKQGTISFAAGLLVGGAFYMVISGVIIAGRIQGVW